MRLTYPIGRFVAQAITVAVLVLGSAVVAGAAVGAWKLILIMGGSDAP